MNQKSLLYSYKELIISTTIITSMIILFYQEYTLLFSLIFVASLISYIMTSYSEIMFSNKIEVKLNNIENKEDINNLIEHIKTVSKKDDISKNLSLYKRGDFLEVIINFENNSKFHKIIEYKDEYKDIDFKIYDLSKLCNKRVNIKNKIINSVKILSYSCNLIPSSYLDEIMLETNIIEKIKSLNNSSKTTNDYLNKTFNSVFIPTIIDSDNIQEVKSLNEDSFTINNLINYIQPTNNTKLNILLNEFDEKIINNKKTI